MARIEVRNATVEYPIYHAGSMSLRNALVAVGTGGAISRNVKNIVTVKAVDNVSFSLVDGDRVGLVGHNGAGKSTLLRTMAGIYRPTQGTVETTGRVSTIFQLGAGLDTELTGYENIVRMAMIMGASKTKALSFIPDIEAFTELGEFLAVPVHAYSAGMTTRLTFAVATAVQPEILLVDEILGVGDVAFQEKARARLENTIGAARIFVLASHSQAMIELYCNRVLHFDHGRLVEDRKLHSTETADKKA